MSKLIIKGDKTMSEWSHAGGKLRELGPESLTDAELLSILISSGIKGKPAEKIADYWGHILISILS